MYENLAIIGIVVFVYSIVSGGVEKTPVNGALIFTACGLALGPLGLGVLNLNVDREGLRTIAELTLALVLFTDAANANLAILKKSFHIPQRLLLIGLPLTIALGFGAGLVLFDELSLFEVAILATMLAPTDAALGKAVVTNQAVPANIREGLNVESGLNDGICVPILFVFLALAIDTGMQGNTPMLAFKLVAQQIGIGLVVGGGLTLLGSWLIRQFAQRDWITKTWRQLPVVALSVVCFAIAQTLGGSGFIACFAGGLLFGAVTKPHKGKLLLAAEGTGDTLALVTWLLFGAGVIGQAIGSFTWQVVAYSILSLTLIRMLPVFLTLTGMGLHTDEKLFMGWFGPRGLASIVFVVIVLNDNVPGGQTIAMTAVCTIVLSVFAHGVSANPLVKILTARLQS